MYLYVDLLIFLTSKYDLLPNNQVKMIAKNLNIPVDPHPMNFPDYKGTTRFIIPQRPKIGILLYERANNSS